MPRTIYLEAVIDASDHPLADEAAEELRRLHASHEHLLTCVSSVYQQTDSTIESVTRVLLLLGKI